MRSSAKEAHARLLASIETRGRKVLEHQISPSDIRHLIAELRRVSLAHAQRASEALRELVETGCRFEYEQENMGGERHRVVLRMKDIPFIDSTCTALPLISSFADLPQRQQASLAQLLEEENTVRDLEIRLQIEQQDGTRAGQVQRTLALASAQASFNRALLSISPSGRDWLAMHRDTLNLHDWSSLPLPILGTARVVPEQLLQASESLGRISDCLIMPFPLEPKVAARTHRRWLELWQVCEEAAENLSMVAAWLRCLGSTGEYKRCRVCFRHVGEGMKKNCWLHQRNAKTRVSSRELHVADLYHDGWRHTAEHHPQIRMLLNEASPTRETQAFMRQAAEQEQLAPEVTMAAATLAALLRTVLPLMDPRLQVRIKHLFDASVADANQRFMARRGISRTTALAPAGQALSGLSWERFFGNLFASPMSAVEATGFAAGKLTDIDHPLASTREAITVQKLALDLLHLSTWISVDLMFDAYGYLDVEAVQRTLRESARKNRTRPSYQELAEIHHTTPQAIHQALSRQPTGKRRYRVLNQGRNALRASISAARERAG